MALEIVQRRWCDGIKLGSGPGDFVARHVPPVEGSIRTFAADGGKLMNVDLCDLCNSGPDCLNLDELRVVLRESGIAVEAGKPDKRGSATKGSSTDKVMDCLWCPNSYTKPGFPGHLKSQHGFDGLKDAFGTTCPACGQGPFDGLSLHVTRIHTEFASLTDAFLWARDNNDPYGVYGQRRAAGEPVVDALL